MTDTFESSLLKDIIEHIDLIAYDVNIISGQIQWMGALEALTGFSLDVVQRWGIDQWRSYIHPEDRDDVDKAIARAREDNRPYQLEYRFMRHGGDSVWLEDNGLFRENGDVHMIGAIRDITQRKTAEFELVEYQTRLDEMVARRTAELVDSNNRLNVEIQERCRSDAAFKASEERYRRVFENTGAATILIDADKTIVMANAKAFELSGAISNRRFSAARNTAF